MCAPHTVEREENKIKYTYCLKRNRRKKRGASLKRESTHSVSIIDAAANERAASAYWGQKDRRR